MSTDIYRRFAAACTFSAAGVSPSDAPRLRGFREHLSTADAFTKQALLIGAAACNATPIGAAMTKAASSPETPGAKLLAEIVIDSLGRVKCAFPIVAAAHDKLGGSVLKTLVSAGILGGTGVGSLAFLLNRKANQSSEDSAQLLEKVRTMNELKREIEEDQRMADMVAKANPQKEVRRYDIR